MLNSTDTINQDHVTFTGDSKDYFSIWIVNLFLTIVTFGIYSAWAKVRNKRYFYGHTKVDGHNFEYLATPQQVLKGRLFALVLFGSYTIAGQLLPLLSIGLAIIMMLLSPWIICSAMRFNLRNTRYRNIRFDFHGTYKDAAQYFILLPLLGVLSLGFAYPWVLMKLDQFLKGHISYGGKRLAVHTKVKEYYSCVLLIFISIVTMAMFIGVFIYASSQILPADIRDSSSLTLFKIVGLSIASIYYLFLFVVPQSIYRARIRNYIYSNSHFEGLAHFKSNIKLSDDLWISITNILAIVFSLGLAYPWAKIRMSRFLARCTTVELDQNFDRSIEDVGQSGSAFGEEASDFFDIDIAMN